VADTPEKKVKKKIVAILKKHNVYYFYPVTGGYGASGVPDVIACVNGVFFGIEAKADMKKNKPTALQLKNLTDIEAAGGVALVIDAHNLDVLEDKITQVILSDRNQKENRDGLVRRNRYVW
jgi:Holliday junction resolvase